MLLHFHKDIRCLPVSEVASLSFAPVTSRSPVGDNSCSFSLGVLGQERARALCIVPAGHGTAGHKSTRVCHVPTHHMESRSEKQDRNQPAQLEKRSSFFSLNLSSVLN